MKYLFLLLTLQFSFPAYAQTQAIDGKTIRLGNDTIRLIGYDTPVEPDTSCGEDTVLAHESKKFLQSLLDNPAMRKDFERIVTNRHEKVFARLFINGKDIADLMIEQELAVKYDCTDDKCPPPIDWCINFR